MKNIKIKNFKLKLPEIIFISALGVVILSFLFYYLIDLRNFLNLRVYLYSLDFHAYPFYGHQYFFRHWGRNQGIAEIIQFILLLSSTITTAYIAGLEYKNNNKKVYKFWKIMSIAFGLMLIEDAGEIRHTFRHYVQNIFNESTQGVYGTFFEFIYFFILAIIPIYAIIFYGKFLLKLKKTRIYIVIGFSFYFLASFLSHLGTLTHNFFANVGANFYTLLGESFYRFSLKISTQNLEQYWLDDRTYISHYLMDSLIEENIEIIGASAFLAASVSYLIYINNKNKKILNK